MLRKYIVLLNGPAGSGKDTIANAIAERFENAVVKKFAQPLKLGAAGLYCGGDMELFNYFDHEQTRKNTPCKQFLGKSCRQVQIDLSEEFLKKHHSEKVFGEILAESISRDTYQLTLVSDSGFRPEAEVLVNTFGAENILLVRLHRKGHTYQGDSRSYISLDDLGVVEYDLQNSGWITDAVLDLESMLIYWT